ncbi:MAG: hypothetical protein GX684_05680 [Ruminococcaceae bacterium]|nr:hypothetical protein [Oscillospiraceae bacterium]
MNNNNNDYKEKFMSAFKSFSEAARDLAMITGAKAKEITRDAGVKAKALNRLATLSLDLNNQKDSLNKAYAALGLYYYESNKDNPGEIYEQLFEAVRLADERTKQIEDELSELKASIGEALTSTGSEENFETVVDKTENDATFVAPEEKPAEEIHPDIEVEIVETAEEPKAEEEK